MSKIDEIRARRKARREDLEAQRDAQLVTDYEAIEGVEDELGPGNVSVVELNAWAPGLPVAYAVKLPSKAVYKRYQARIRPTKRRGEDVPGDAVAAAEEVGSVCLVYPPEGELRDKLLEERPTALTQAGTEAISMLLGATEAEGKG